MIIVKQICDGCAEERELLVPGLGDGNVDEMTQSHQLFAALSSMGWEPLSDVYWLCRDTCVIGKLGIHASDGPRERVLS